MGQYSFVIAAAALLTASGVLITDFVCYFFLTPSKNPPPAKPRRVTTAILHIIMFSSMILSLLRIPFAVLPYLCKIMLFFASQGRSQAIWRSSNAIQLLRIVGDVLNFYATVAIMRLLIPSADESIQLIVALCAAAEAIRLITEKGQMLFSAAWQMLPHRQIAVLLHPVAHLFHPIKRYCDYYSRSVPARLAFVIDWLTCRSAGDVATAQRLAYVKGFYIVSKSHVLGAGYVRDVARGLIYIHTSWANDPWLLIGQAMRRGTWLFDPRWLARPFYYRTKANPLAARFVLSHADYSPPYAWYQFGHEIKVARYEVFYTLLSWLGIQGEKPILQDGTYAFDSLLMRWGAIVGWITLYSASEPMRSNEETIADIIRQANGKSLPDALEIAERYSYPLEYVETGLMPQLEVEVSQMQQ